MGGSSNTNSSSTTTKTFKPTQQINPYFTTSTNKKGKTVTKFAPGTAGQTTYDFVNNNISTLLDNYLNPTLDSSVNKARMDLFQKQQANNLQNNIINPLAANNMIRSSQATNMYNNLSNQSADYGKELIANSQNDTWNMINNLMGLYMNGYTGASGEEKASIQSSLGGGNSVTNTSGKAG